jgi:hypothetical protein
MRPLQSTDFRSTRRVLEPDDFGLGSEGPDPPPSDLIDIATWNSIVSLPDDVSVRTSNHFGSELVRTWSYSNDWNCLAGALQESLADSESSPLSDVALDVGDELQTSVYNALVGYYRVAFSCLRTTLEMMSVGLRFELEGRPQAYQDWLNGKSEAGVGMALDFLSSFGAVRSLETQLMTATGDNLFRQKTSRDLGGLARRTFNELSKFTHGAPGFTDSAMRQSNGPIFVPASFEKWVLLYTKTMAIMVLEARLGNSNLGALSYDSSSTVHELFDKLIGELPSSEDGTSVLRSIPQGIW